MKRWMALAGALLLGSAACAAPAEGRWEGRAEIPGAPLAMVVDLQRTDALAWVGSVILPGRGVKGAPLAGIRVDDRGVQFSLAAAFATAPSSTPTEVELRWQADGRLAGEFRQGGHRAALTLSRSGAAQADLPTPTMPLSPEMRGVWRGRYELGGYAREVTVTLNAVAASGGAGEIVIVGKRRSVLAIDRVVQGREFITLDSSEGGVRIEGRWRNADGRMDGRIDGHFLQGPFEAALVLRQESRPAPAAQVPP